MLLSFLSRYILNTCTLALSNMVFGVKLYSSSRSAGRKVPEPRTSGCDAAISAAMVSAKMLYQWAMRTWYNLCRTVAYPPTAPSNISPFTSFPGLSSPLACIQAPAQNVAMHVPTIHPDPVMLPSSLCPLSSLITVVPSDTQSVGPVKATTQPEKNSVHQSKGVYEKDDARSLSASSFTNFAGSANPGPRLSTPLPRTYIDY